MKNVSELIDEGVFDVLELTSVVNARTSYGGTAHSQVEKQINLAKELL